MEKSNIRVLVLGHKGMLGHVVLKYLKSKNISIRTIEYKWPSSEFINEIINSQDDFLINCIGSIPQKNKNSNEFILNNFLLPVFLSKYFENTIIHPSSDCEFINNNDDLYADSKFKAFSLLKGKKNVRIIKASIIGPELNNNKSLWSWFENIKSNKVFGYTNHYWNGITTLKWAEIAWLIINQTIDKKIIVAGTESISKFSLLTILNKKLNLNKIIIDHETPNAINRILKINLLTENIEKQIEDMIIWYK